MSRNENTNSARADSGNGEGLPPLPEKFSGEAACEDRRRLIRKIIVGVPAVVAMTARGANAGPGGDILAASAPSQQPSEPPP